jgi:hypothetical protein
MEGHTIVLQEAVKNGLWQLRIRYRDQSPIITAALPDRSQPDLTKTATASDALTRQEFLDHCARLDMTPVCCGEFWHGNVRENMFAT